MRRDSGRQLSLTPLVALALGAAVAAALAWLVEGEARAEASPGLVVGVFATFLTSTSIVAAFSIEGKSRWPTPWETLGRAGVFDWFVVALTSVAVALIAVAIDNTFLGAFGLTLALVGLALGARGLWGLFALSSDRGRHALIVDLLADSIRRAKPPDDGGEPDLGEIDAQDHVPVWFSSVRTADVPSGRGVSIDLVLGTLRLYATYSPRSSGGWRVNRATALSGPVARRSSAPAGCRGSRWSSRRRAWQRRRAEGRAEMAGEASARTTRDTSPATSFLPAAASSRPAGIRLRTWPGC